MMNTDDETDPILHPLPELTLLLCPDTPPAPFWCLGFSYPRVDGGLSRVLGSGMGIKDRFDDSPFVWRHFNLI